MKKLFYLLLLVTVAACSSCDKTETKDLKANPPAKSDTVFGHPYDVYANLTNLVPVFSLAGGVEFYGEVKNVSVENGPTLVYPNNGVHYDFLSDNKYKQVTYNEDTTIVELGDTDISISATGLVDVSTKLEGDTLFNYIGTAWKFPDTDTVLFLHSTANLSNAYILLSKRIPILDEIIIEGIELNEEQ